MNPKIQKTIKYLMEVFIPEAESGNVDSLMFERELKRLGNQDYRTCHEKKVDEYVDIFLGGGYITVDQDSRETDRINGTKEVKDPKVVCEMFLAEDFKKVQQPFWKMYKMKYDRCNGSSLTSKEIFNYIQKIKQLKKESK